MRFVFSALRVVMGVLLILLVFHLLVTAGLMKGNDFAGTMVFTMFYVTFHPYQFAQEQIEWLYYQLLGFEQDFVRTFALGISGGLLVYLLLVFIIYKVLIHMHHRHQQRIILG